MEVEIDSNYSKKMKPDKENVAMKDTGKTAIVDGSTYGSSSTDNLNNSNSDLSFHDDENNGYDDDLLDDDDEYMFDDGDADDYSSLQAQFDNVDLPPGVEASVPWLQPSTVTSVKPTPIQSHSATSTPAVSTTSPSLQQFANQKMETVGSSSSSVATKSGSHDGVQVESADDIMEKYMVFKQFDNVDDASDHHYSNAGFQGQQLSKEWIKKIQDEWKILENNLPDTIFVRVYGSRMDLLTAVIVGPQGTPYHDGLFVFDVHFPPNYPDVPPMVYYYSGGLRLNPNLYDCGKVCLSLLNTWTGQGNEMWVPKKSTMLQVLLSIQALILNANPFFNEPGYETSYVGAEGERKSNKYNENAFILSLKTMMYTLRRPPKHFEVLVAGHFRTYAHDILSACKAYMEGAKVGSLVKGKLPEGTEVADNASKEFKDAVGRMVNGLISNFTKNGAKDCEEFRISR